MAHPQSGYWSTEISGSNWNLEMLVFEERGKPEYPGKNFSSREENQQQTQPTYGVESENRSRATMVGGECSHHCAIPAPNLLSTFAVFADHNLPLSTVAQAEVWIFGTERRTGSVERAGRHLQHTMGSGGLSEFLHRVQLRTALTRLTFLHQSLYRRHVQKGRPVVPTCRLTRVLGSG